MGLLDRLGVGGSDATLALALDAEALRPGERVTGQVTIGGTLDDKCRAARFEVRCARRYLTVERSRDAEGDVKYREVWQEETTFEASADVPLELGTHAVALHLPGSAAPSASDAVLWSARAVMDRRRGVDVESDAALRVVARAPKAIAESAEHHDASGLVISGVPPAARAEESIGGTVAFTPAEDLDITGIHVRLEQVRRYRGPIVNGYDAQSHSSSFQRARVWDSGPWGFDVSFGGEVSSSQTQAILEMQVGPATELVAGQTQTFDFEGLVAPESAPTVKTKAADVEYRVVAKVARRLRGDFEVSAPVVVFNDPA